MVPERDDAILSEHGLDIEMKPLISSEGLKTGPDVNGQANLFSREITRQVAPHPWANAQGQLVADG